MIRSAPVTDTVPPGARLSAALAQVDIAERPSAAHVRPVYRQLAACRGSGRAAPTPAARNKGAAPPRPRPGDFERQPRGHRPQNGSAARPGEGPASHRQAWHLGHRRRLAYPGRRVSHDGRRILLEQDERGLEVPGEPARDVARASTATDWRPNSSSSRSSSGRLARLARRRGSAPLPPHSSRDLARSDRDGTTRPALRHFTPAVAARTGITCPSSRASPTRVRSLAAPLGGGR